MLFDAAMRCLAAIKSVGGAIENFFGFSCCCALLSEMLDSTNHSIELARLAHAQLPIDCFGIF